MSDLIDRQAAILQLSHNKCGNDENDIAVQRDIETIRKLSPAQPEIIYCKHCKHRTFHDNRISSEQCYVCDYWDFDDPQPNGFCNFAERREDA